MSIFGEWAAEHAAKDGIAGEVRRALDELNRAVRELREQNELAAHNNEFARVLLRQMMAENNRREALDRAALTRRQQEHGIVSADMDAVG